MTSKLYITFQQEKSLLIELGFLEKTKNYINKEEEKEESTQKN